MDRRVARIVVWLLLCVIWGTTWFFIKIGLRDLPPLSFACARFICAGLILLAVMRARKIPLPRTRRDLKLLAATGLLQFGLNYGAVFWSEQYISSGLAAVLQATIPVFGLLTAWVHLPQERITGRKILSILLGVAGVAAIFAGQLHANGVAGFAGCAAIVAGALAAAESSVLTKSYGASLHPASLLLGQMSFGILPLALVGLLEEGSPLNFRWTPRAVFAVLYLAIVGTIAAFLLYYWLLRRVESTKAMAISLVTPLVAVVVGAVALGERLLPQTYFGGALILGSVCLVALRKRPAAAVKEFTPPAEAVAPPAVTETN
jgi:drug/metabolite transporter (DMT)-like permease